MSAAIDRAQWLQAAAWWRQQEQARKREGKWKDAREAARQAEYAEGKAAELEAAALTAEFPGIAAAYEPAAELEHSAAADVAPMFQAALTPGVGVEKLEQAQEAARG